MNAYDIIIRPILTEKGYQGVQNKTYTFEVNRDANKIQIKNAVKELYGVEVDKVATINVKGVTKIQNTKAGRTIGKTKSYKKAIVTLKKDSKPIAFFESLS